MNNFITVWYTVLHRWRDEARHAILRNVAQYNYALFSACVNWCYRILTCTNNILDYYSTFS